MSTQTPDAIDRRTILSRVVDVQRDEVAALLASFAMFFLLLSAYYIVRPVRDEMGVTVGKDAIHHLFSIVFVVMLAAVPIFGFVASKFPRRIVLPSLYAFFALNLVGFWALFKTHGAGTYSAGAFFVWASVFNLFVVSLFWSLMSELWSNDEATRLYGFVAAGGSAGAVAGPLLTRGLVTYVAPVDLLALSAVLLAASMVMSLYLRRVRQARAGGAAEAVGGGIFDGVARLLQSPYLAHIALFVFLANIVGTMFYMEQSRLVGATILDSAERIRFFAGRDMIVSVATILIQLLGTAAIMRRFGLTAALMALPVTAALGILALGYAPTLWVVAAVMVAERVSAFALANPAVKVMYTLTSADEKYKVQNFVDTVVYRGGDAASGWLFAAVSRGAGFSAVATPLVALPLAAIWIWNARRLGKGYEDRSQDLARETVGLKAA